MAAVIAIGRAPFCGKRNVPPGRPLNREVRAREYLTIDELERMVAAARRSGGRLAKRDELLVMMGYRHGLRASELIALRWDQIDWKAGTLAVTRLKQGSAATHFIRGPELRALRAWKREQGESPYVFTSLRRGPMSRFTVHAAISALGRAAGIEFPVHPHMLRHATGYYMANSGQDTRLIQGYLGHKNIRHTVRYSELDANRYKDVWKD